MLVGTGLPQGIEDHLEGGSETLKADQDSIWISPPVLGLVASCLGL